VSEELVISLTMIHVTAQDLSEVPQKFQILHLKFKAVRL